MQRHTIAFIALLALVLAGSTQVLAKRKKAAVTHKVPIAGFQTCL
jgi:hypothetical protein